MAKAFNPFEHHHSHDHDDHAHGHAHEPLDPAQKSLADALRVSFGILKLVMIVLVGLYLISGIFHVPNGEEAIILRFGRIVGDNEETQVARPGKLRFAMPFPIDQVVTVPVTERTVKLDEEFYFRLENKTQDIDQAAASAGDKLDPIKHGSLLTGDANIIHAQWTITYRITKPVDFVRNLADLSNTSKEKMLREAELIVKAAAEEGIVFAVAQLPADDLIKKQTKLAADLAKAHALKTLAAMKTGVEITSIAVQSVAMPLPVRAAYKKVTEAESEAAKIRADKEKERAEMLGAVAGEAHEALWDLIKQYDNAVDTTDAAAIAALEVKLAAAFAEGKVAAADGRIVTISGDAAAMVSEAAGYASQVANRARSDAETFRKLKAEYAANPRIFLSREWNNVKQRIFSNDDIETIYVPPGGAPYLLFNRDPDLARKREEARQKAKEDELKKQNPN